MTVASASGSVSLKSISKSFRKGVPVLDGVDFDFPPGELTYILGPSGSGKSVLIKHILGILAPDSGSVWVNGVDISTLGRRELSEHRLLFGMLFQNSALFDDMSVFENVAFPLREHTKLSDTEIEARVYRVLDQLKMPGGREGYSKFPNELSGGMKKRVALARAIIREPQILLYDEPTTGLDPVTRVTVDELIEQLKRELKLTSIVISHDIPSALLLADRIAFLYQGKIAFNGTPQEFKQSNHEAIQTFLRAEHRSMRAFRDGELS